MSLQNVKIGKRLMAGFTILIAIVLVLCIVSWVSMNSIGSRIDEIVNVNFQKVNYANAILTNIQAIDNAVGVGAMSGNKSFMAVIPEKRKLYLEAFEKLEKMETDQTGKDLINKFKTNIAAGRETNSNLMKMVEEGKLAEATQTYTTVIIPSTARNIEIAGEIVKFQEKGVQDAQKAANAAQNRAKIILIIIAVLAIIFCVLVSMIVTRSLTIPIQKNIEVARTLADGNLSVHVDVDRKDEFGDELQAFKAMIEKWKALISEVKASAESVASASHELSASSEQLARGASAQVEKTLQVSTASEEMSQASLDIAKNTNAISDSSKEMVSTAQNGNKIVNRSVEEVKEIAKTVQKSSDLVKELGNQSQKIGEIVNVINEIADQTNLLALNAAIEAARAGEAGRGFAVVADEVKKLAERTGKSTQEIGDMIGSIRSGVDNAVKAMDDASDKVKTGVELSNEAGLALGDIVKSSSSLQSMVQQIAAAIEEMNATTDEIARDIEHVATVTKESSVSAEHVTQAALELSNLSVKLEQSVKGFRV